MPATHPEGALVEVQVVVSLRTAASRLVLFRASKMVLLLAARERGRLASPHPSKMSPKKRWTCGTALLRKSSSTR